jgi:hypothetical protein
MIQYFLQEVHVINPYKCPIIIFVCRISERPSASGDQTGGEEMAGCIFIGQASARRFETI